MATKKPAGAKASARKGSKGADASGGDFQRRARRAEKSRSKALAKEATPKAHDFGEMLSIFHAAAQGVWSSPEVWQDERSRIDASQLRWPMSEDKEDSFRSLLAILFNVEVDHVLARLLRFAPDHPQTPAYPPDLADDRFQVLLRVIVRATESGRQELMTRYGDGQRVFGLREYRNEFRSCAVDWLERSGMRRALGDEAFAVFDISRAAAYRAMRRKR